MIADEVEMNKDSHHRAKMVPKNLSDEQKENCLSISQEMLDYFKTEPNFMYKVITEGKL